MRAVTYIRTVLHMCSVEEAWVVYDALQQYVDNGSDEPDAREAQQLALAQALLEKMNDAVAHLASDLVEPPK